MNKSESKALTKAERKEKIRQRYKGRDTEDVDVIPANKSYDFYDEVNRRVAVYVRVSTDNLQQTSSYELQKNYYEDMVNKNPHWELVHIYADEGISGTSLNHRDAFNQMIADCKAGKIDMIITKSVSRFARNVKDCITIVDELSELRNPIGVFFETEHIFTLDKKNEITLSFTASMAQEESHIKSNIMNASIEMRFSHGILLTPVLLGYNHDEEGNLVINEEEAETVRLIFFMYLYGFKIKQIAEQLTKLRRSTKKGNTQWNSSSVVGILRNERYCGDVLTSKTFTPSYKNHKARKNNGDRTQYRWKDQHEPIISRDDFIAVNGLSNYPVQFTGATVAQHSLKTVPAILETIPLFTVIDSGILCVCLDILCPLDEIVKFLRRQFLFVIFRSCVSLQEDNAGAVKAVQGRMSSLTCRSYQP